MGTTQQSVLDAAVLGEGVTVTERAIDRFARGHDASHYLLIPQVVATPSTAADMVGVLAAARKAGRSITFRSGGTSLSGQGVTDQILVDTRKQFRRIDVLEEGRRVRVQPGATVRQVNAHLARFGRKLGPDPASEIACTVGGIVANNSSGMACGIEQNSYRTLESMTVILPDGSIIDTAAADADDQLSTTHPDLYAGLTELRDRVRTDPHSVELLRHQFSMKNTMGYGLNSFLDFERPIDLLSHLIIGSEGTLAFVAEVVFETIPIRPVASTGLAIFPDLATATAALPALVAAGLATIELMDAESLRAAQLPSDAPRVIRDLVVASQCALLIELQAATDRELTDFETAAAPTFAGLTLESPLVMSRDAAERDALWHVRKGLYTTVAGARPSGTTALLEDIVVPVAELRATCEELTELFGRHGYEGSVIFGHAKDGNIHFMLNERFGDDHDLGRYQRFTEEMVELVLAHSGNLKAEHGTGRIMAPFVERQYGSELYDVMRRVKDLFDPEGILNPGVLLTSDADSYLHNLKSVPTVESEVDRCVECGYCEPSCPSKNLTMTPRQRIVVRRELAAADARGDTALAAELRDDYEYDGVETCAVDGLCAVACPVDINTGDLVRRLRAESRGRAENAIWKSAARHWKPLSELGAVALDAAHAVPAPLPIAATRVGRAVVGTDVVPLYDRGLPRGGSRRRAISSDQPLAVFFSACIGTMFGPADGSHGVTSAFMELCDRAGVSLVTPDALGDLCCGTPWKSKGYLGGYSEMTDRVLPALLEASQNGKLPIVCDAASCTEGLVTMARLKAAESDEFTMLRFVDATEFVLESVLSALTVTTPVPSVVVHHTCSSTELGLNSTITRLARFVSDDVTVPIDTGCCAFAGDRGLLHPELTASATRDEAIEVGEREFTEYVSANRTCELGMSRATGRSYRHVIEILEQATRPNSVG